MRARTGWMLGCSLAGAALFFVLFPKFYVSRRSWSFSISRQQAERIAREVAGRYGVDITDWAKSAAYEESRPQQEARQAAPNDPVLSGFQPLSLRVLAVSPNGRDHVLVTLTPQGSLLAYESRSP